MIKATEEIRERFKGRKCKIYKLPSVKRNLEGEAIIDFVSFIDEEDHFLYCHVKFIGQEFCGNFERWVDIDDIEK